MLIASFAVRRIPVDDGDDGARSAEKDVTDGMEVENPLVDQKP